MISRTILLGFIVTLFMGACKKVSIAHNTPSCIRNEISTNAHNDNWEVGSVDEYRYHDSLVYTFVPDGRIIADGAAVVRDENCHVVCSFGGFGGPGVNLCNGENFETVAVFTRNIWRKNN